MEQTIQSNRRSLSLASASSALLVAAVLLIGIVGLATQASSLRPWLAVLFGVDSGWDVVSFDSLHAVSAIDIAVLALAGVAFLGFWPGPGRPHRLFMGLAVLLPLAGIAVLIATGLWGRSGLMGGGLVLSALLLGHPRFRPLGLLGLAANLLLLVGDFATRDARALLVAGLVGVGYVLLIAWFVWIAAKLLTGWRHGHT